MSEIVVRLSGPAARVSVRLGSGAWIRCAVTARTARCPVPPAQGSAAALERLSVVATA